MRYIFWTLYIGLLLNAACKRETMKPAEVTGKVSIEFIHTVNGTPLLKDSLCYVNEAGNRYMINELKYFVSDVYLGQKNGTKVHIDAQKAIQYVDIDIPATTIWPVFDPIPEGTYDSISFTFGLNKQRNVSFAFVNPPEVNMFWPDILGGGYHYLMLNGKWKNQNNQLRPFDFHIGIGQVYKGTTSSVDSISGYVQNYFEVKLPLASIQVVKGTTKTIHLVMHVESWFKTPHTWDFNYWGSYIMQNQIALRTAAENGMDVFSEEE